MSHEQSAASNALIRDLAGTALHQRFVFAIGAVAFVVVGALTWAADAWLRRVMAAMPADQMVDTRLGLLLAAALVLSLLLVGLGFVSRFVMRRVSAPALQLAAISERVASGDLTVQVPGTAGADEMARLSRATEAMLLELRRLVAAIDASSQRTSQMAAEITTGAEQMTSAAAEIAQTSNDLSGQATRMAETVQHTVTDASRLRDIAGQLTGGARDGVERNARLLAMVRENRTRLDDSNLAFDRLVTEATGGAAAADTLVTASEEIRAFLTLMRRMARQSKLLALNASMEAARAGELGEGFGVVATEIRKMATGTAAAAERTQRVVDDVLSRVDQTRESSRRTLATVEAVREETAGVIASFGQIESLVHEMERWTASIDGAAVDSARVVDDTTGRLETLAAGVENFAAAMQQVAASAQEQSASTQEIAAAASALAAASRGLYSLVSTFRTERLVTKPVPPAVRRGSDERRGAASPTTGAAVLAR